MEGLSATLNLVAEESNFGGPIGMYFYVAIVLIVMFGLAAWAKTGLTGRVFVKPITRYAEHCYLFIEHMCVSVIGPKGKKYVPFVLTIWLFIFLSNMLGLILPHTPTADWAITAALAVIVFCYVQFEGIRQNGLFGHVRHFAGPKMDALVLALLITPLIFCIELLSEFIKILSLSIRLYGNIHAGHVTKDNLNNLIPSFHVLGGAVLPLEVLVCIIQAFVFSLLTCIYLSLVSGHGEHDAEDNGHGEHSSSAAHGATAHA